MNKEQTAIEVDALEWFNNLEDDTASRLYKLYFPVVSKDTYYNDIIFIYTAEHPTATTVKENNEVECNCRASQLMNKKKERWIEHNKLKSDNKALIDAFERLELHLENLIFYTPEDHAIRNNLMQGGKIIKDAFVTIGHVSANKE